MIFLVSKWSKLMLQKSQVVSYIALNAVSLTWLLKNTAPRSQVRWELFSAHVLMRLVTSVIV